jgi:hypothetical protein
VFRISGEGNSKNIGAEPPLPTILLEGGSMNN